MHGDPAVPACLGRLQRYVAGSKGKDHEQAIADVQYLELAWERAGREARKQREANRALGEMNTRAAHEIHDLRALMRIEDSFTGMS